MHKNGLTLLEILISTLILALVMAGLANIFISAKKFTLHARSRIQAAELGKLFLDPLQMQVREDTWGLSGNALYTGVTGSLTTYCDSGPGQQNLVCPPAADRKLDNITYSAEYNITALGTTNLRKVVTTIRWNEPTEPTP